MDPLSHSHWNVIEELHRRLYLRIANNWWYRKQVSRTRWPDPVTAELQKRIKEVLLLVERVKETKKEEANEKVQGGTERRADKWEHENNQASKGNVLPRCWPRHSDCHVPLLPESQTFLCHRWEPLFKEDATHLSYDIKEFQQRQKSKSKPKK